MKKNEIEKEYQRVNIRLTMPMREKIGKECKEMGMSISAFFNVLANNYFKEKDAISNIELYKAYMENEVAKNSKSE